jgi:hypothetical protein
VLLLHLGELAERLILDLGHSHGVEKLGVGVHVVRLGRAEREQHHANLGDRERPHILLGVAGRDVGVGLREEAE